MYLPIFQVDAFTAKPFGGNPAAVCPLPKWLDDDLLRAVAAENNLSETAYLVARGEDYDLRWFTPVAEVKLCGHATLASALVVLQILSPTRNSVSFHTRFSGQLTVHRDGDLLTMDFPAKKPWPCPNPPAALLEGLAARPTSVVQIEDDYFAIYDNAQQVRNIRPDFHSLEKLHPYGIAVTALGEDCDFVSRFFVPSYGILEDPVTGSTHCSLAPYWGERLSKTRLHARQLSQRGGELWCELQGDRVLIKGHAVLVMRGEFVI